MRCSWADHLFLDCYYSIAWVVHLLYHTVLYANLPFYLLKVCMFLCACVSVIVTTHIVCFTSPMTHKPTYMQWCWTDLHPSCTNSCLLLSPRLLVRLEYSIVLGNKFVFRQDRNNSYVSNYIQHFLSPALQLFLRPFMLPPSPVLPDTTSSPLSLFLSRSLSLSHSLSLFSSLSLSHSTLSFPLMLSLTLSVSLFSSLSLFLSNSLSFPLTLSLCLTHTLIFTPTNPNLHLLTLYIHIPVLKRIHF